MHDIAKLMLLARAVIERYGANASTVARIRAVECSEEPEVADIWTEVAEFIDNGHAWAVSVDRP